MKCCGDPDTEGGKIELCASDNQSATAIWLKGYSSQNTHPLSKVASVDKAFDAGDEYI